METGRHNYADALGILRETKTETNKLTTHTYIYVYIPNFGR